MTEEQPDIMEARDDLAKISLRNDIIFKYVFTYYNRIRVYTANPGGYPPAVYRELSAEQLLAA